MGRGGEMIPDTIKALKFRKYFKQYSYINGCKIKDIIKLLTLIDGLYKQLHQADAMTNEMVVNEMLSLYNITPLSVILIYQQRWVDFSRLGMYSIDYFLKIFMNAVDSGLTFIYELEGCKIEGGL